ncbi:glycosyltransferase family 39 protein [bacterium]|nr:glycosyltransferase family 39 protein [bacterium]
MTHAATILIPTLNEAGTIDGLIRSIFADKPEHYDYRIIVIDDGSTDGTIDLVRDLEAHFPVSLIERGRKLGLSSAVLDGARAAQTEWVLVMDADGSHPVAGVKQLLAAHFEQGLDCAIGSRYCDGGLITGWPLKRRLLSGFGTWMSRSITPVHDPLSGFFSCRRELVLDAGRRSDGYKILFEILANLPEKSRVKEIPIHFTDRQRGTSKISARVQLLFFLQFFRLLKSELVRIVRQPYLRQLGWLFGLEVGVALLLYCVGHLPVRLTSAVSFFFFSILVFLVTCADRDYHSFFSQRRWLNFSILTLIWAFSFHFMIEAMLYCLIVIDKPGIVIVLIALAIQGLVFFKGCIVIKLLMSKSSTWGREVRQTSLMIMLLLSVFLGKLFILGLIDLAPQEALHWNRAMHLAPAYVDHPGGVAVLIRSTTAILGHGEFGVRFGSFVCGLITMLFMYRIGKLLTGKRFGGYLSAFFINLLPFFWGNGILVFPDAPLMAAWSGAVYFFSKALSTDKDRTWIAAGFFLGLAMFSKYTAIFLYGSIGLFFLLHYPGLGLLRKRPPYLVILASIFPMLPLIMFEMGQNWSTFRYQFIRRMDHAFWAFPDYLIVLIGEASPFIFVLGIIVCYLYLVRWRKIGPHAQWLLLTSVPILLLFAVYSQWNRVKYSWTSPAFIGLVPLIVHFIMDEKGRFIRLKRLNLGTLLFLLAIYTFLLPLVLTMQLNYWPFSNLKKDVIWSHLDRPLERIEREIVAETKQIPFIIGLDKYYLASEVSYYGGVERSRVTSRNAIGLDGLTWNKWSILEHYRGLPAILLAQKRKDIDPDAIKPFFDRLTGIETLRIDDGFQSRTIYYLIGYDYTPPPPRH